MPSRGVVEGEEVVVGEVTVAEEEVIVVGEAVVGEVVAGVVAGVVAVVGGAAVGEAAGEGGVGVGASPELMERGVSHMLSPLRQINHFQTVPRNDRKRSANSI